MRNIIGFFIKYPTWGYALILLIFSFGFISLSKLNRSFFPETIQRIITVEVTYPGASPQEMEEGVTLKVEQSLKGIEGIEQITSTSSENRATITVEATQFVDPDMVLTDVKNAVDRISSFPDGAEKPVVYKRKGLERVVSIVLTGTDELSILKKYADIIEDELLASSIVTQTEIKGIPPREVSIEVSEETLRKYQLTFSDIVLAIRRENLDFSAGSIKSDHEEILIRSRQKHHTKKFIDEIVIKTLTNGSKLLVSDIADVKEQFAEQPEKIIYNNTRAINIDVSKTPDEDTFEITDYIKNYIETFNENQHEVELIGTNYRSTTVSQRINLLLTNGGVGLLLVLFTLGIFLNIRVAFWVAIGIPVSFFGMFIVAGMYGITINVISLFGMIIVVGILVDDAIVISENIYTHYEKHGNAYRAAIDGTMEVFPSVFASVTTTIVAFLPFFFLEGRLGEFIQEMALVVVACLAISLIEGAIILPDHLAHTLKNQSKKTGKLRQFFDDALDFFRNKIYRNVLKVIVKYYYISFAIVLFFIFSVVGMVKGGMIKFTFFPYVDSDNVKVELTMPPGTREFNTESVLFKIKEHALSMNEDLKKDRTDGKDVILNSKIEINSSLSEQGSIEFELLDGETRDMESFIISSMLRERVGFLPEVEKITFGGRMIFGKPLSVSVIGNNQKSLKSALEMLKSEISKMPQLKDITDNEVLGKREIQIKLKTLAYSLGLTTSDIMRQIRQGYFGEEVQRIQVGKDEIKLWVRYTTNDRKRISGLEEMRIKMGNQLEYPLRDLVDYQINRSVVSINHFNGSKEIKVEADLADLNEPVPPLVQHVKDVIIPKLKNQFPDVRYSFEGQDKQNQKFNRSASNTFPLALGVMFIIIVLTFRSVPQAVVIILLIPLGILGAMVGHLIEGKPVSILSIYGFIALAGIVINDSVVFVSKFNDLLKQGTSFIEAVIEAGVARYRAILLTSVTTVVGLYPLILEKSRQAQFLIPMAIAVAWGVLFATIFTLIVLPVLLVILNDLRIVIKWIWTGIKPSREEVEPSIIEIKRLDEFGK